ncbi:11204_t:CDS:2, partial [Funneliformis mosseae]
HATTCSMGIPTSWIRYPTFTTMGAIAGRAIAVFLSSYACGTVVDHYQRPDIEKQQLEKKNALQTYECRTKIKRRTQVMMKDLADETVLES